MSRTSATLSLRHAASAIVRMMDGVLVIDKPAGPTSHDVVAVARRALHEHRIGHTGTLDPLATGVLPLVIGRATRLASLLSATEKEYEAGIRLGASTATYDAAERLSRGEPPPPPPPVSVDQVSDVLASFTGSFAQTPPAFSAKKVSGTAAYELARRNRPAELAPATVTVHELALLGLDAGLLRLRVAVSTGFYVRSLAHDIGQALGCGAYLESLRRTRVGVFRAEGSTTLDELLQATDRAVSRLVPLSQLATELPAVTLTQDGAKRAAHGNPLSPRHVAAGAPGLAAPGGRTRLLDESGALLAIAVSGPDGVLRPSVVLV